MKRKGYKYVEIIIDSCEKDYLEDIIDRKLYPVQMNKKETNYRGLLPQKDLDHQLSMIWASPYTAGYTIKVDHEVYFDGNRG